MKIAEVEGYLGMIRENARIDPERAHAAEDGMMRDVLRAIADGGMTKAQMSELAAAVLKSDDIEFERWAA